MNNCGTCKYCAGPNEDGEYICTAESDLRIPESQYESGWLVVKEDFECVLWEAKV